MSRRVDLGLHHRRQVVSRRFPAPQGGFTVRPTGHEVLDLHLEVDPDALVTWLASRASSSKRGIAKACGGAVTLRVVGRTREPS